MRRARAFLVGLVVLSATALSAQGADTAQHVAPGAVLDARSFRVLRALPEGAGLTAVVLDPAALAHSRIGDLRILDAKGRQVPYVIETVDEPQRVTLPAPVRSAGPARDHSVASPGGGTRHWYRIQLPYAGLPDATLRLTTTARVFQREVAVVTHEGTRDEHPAHARGQVLRARWSHEDARTAAPPLEVALGHRLGGDSLLVMVEDGDNVPLPLVSATLLLPTHRLRFFREAGAPLRLAYGHSTLASPRYDLALLGGHVVAARATEVVAAPEAAPARAAGGSAAIFWGALGIVVVVLLALVARLVKAGAGSGPEAGRERAGDDPGPTPDPSP